MNTYFRALDMEGGYFLDLTIGGANEVSALDKKLQLLGCSISSGVTSYKQNQDGTYSVRLLMLSNINQCLETIQNAGFFVVSHQLEHATTTVKGADKRMLATLIEPFAITVEELASRLAKKKEETAKVKLAQYKEKQKREKDLADQVCAKVKQLCKSSPAAYRSLVRLCSGTAQVLTPSVRTTLLAEGWMDKNQRVTPEVKQAVKAVTATVG